MNRPDGFELALLRSAYTQAILAEHDAQDMAELLHFIEPLTRRFVPRVADNAERTNAVFNPARTMRRSGRQRGKNGG